MKKYSWEVNLRQRAKLGWECGRTDVHTQHLNVLSHTRIGEANRDGQGETLPVSNKTLENGFLDKTGPFNKMIVRV